MSHCIYAESVPYVVPFIFSLSFLFEEEENGRIHLEDIDFFLCF